MRTTPPSPPSPSRGEGDSFLSPPPLRGRVRAGGANAPRPTLIARFLACRRGSNAVEFALVAPLLIGFLFGIYEVGLEIWTQGILDFAVEQAARCATVNSSTCGTASAIETYAATQTTPLGLPSSTFTATTATCGNQVTASYDFVFVGTFPIKGKALLPNSITLTSTSCYPT
jgi:Flp pilus assembly protein TadG